MRSLSFGTSSTVTTSLPFPFKVIVAAGSSASEAGDFLERVAVRMVCLSEERRVNVRDEPSRTSGGDAGNEGI